ncbi:hypothetical protein CC85DRAFT_327004 [Cutaneotrichosporon oleaginosum]|uniref:Uncharacterized protein n=1 Tax=Cutaneotrichosporon oleaginosum TaxID=879819 RepID=A0A0J1B7X0_9TREE|nr:uncharacterized protein CC85DRAFT_327004 [Cutaneotrichosporon oleaginosum]KLT43869.1 hypothetical protein CC85DRAFT_327004 [Cutaneotrichosporon oleaginosum]TXT06391.1 hypothetical protein COLE_05722 [Cutaneotrichosporon oleaginosum]
MYHRTRSSCASYDTASTAVYSLSRSTSWSGMTAVESVGRCKYPTAPKQAFPVVVEAIELAHTALPPTYPMSSAPSTLRPARPTRPFPGVDPNLCADTRFPPPHRFRFSTYEPARPPTALSCFSSSTTHKEKSLLRRAITHSLAHIRNLSSGSLQRVRSLSRRAGCRRASVYDPKFVALDNLPDKLEPASPPDHRSASRVSRVILQVPRAEPLLPAVLAAAEDVKLENVNLTAAISELAQIVTPGERARASLAYPLAGSREASRPDSQLLPPIDFSAPPSKCRPPLPADFGGPVVTCSRRASRPQFTYI